MPNEYDSISNRRYYTQTNTCRACGFKLKWHHLAQVNGACEMLGLDPLYVANEGIFTAFLDPEIAKDLLRLLKSLPGGQNACVIGEVVSEHQGQVVMQSIVGGRRVIQMLPGDQLPRIC